MLYGLKTYMNLSGKKSDSSVKKDKISLYIKHITKSKNDWQVKQTQ
ncbi:hypothetical protein LCGC14_2055270 [marine sediment metagenome]|uniref:Uncharacterized protein n=1 Tax=marine sediment metagenome TaxID=412755 RepID=A0A0F9EMS8_9ZZZZ